MVSSEPDHPAAQRTGDEPEVSFAEVAAEDPSESLEHEAELVEEIGDGEPGADSGTDVGADSGLRAGTDDEPVLGQPTLGSSMGGAPVPGGE